MDWHGRDGARAERKRYESGKIKFNGHRDSFDPQSLDAVW